MQYILVCLVTFGASIITLLSGFGLGTALMPVFAIFFPLPLAIATTAVIHLANSLFQVILVGKYADVTIIWKFGIPAVVSACSGAYLLEMFSQFNPLFPLQIGGIEFYITPIRCIVGMIVMMSSLLELNPKLKHFSFPAHYIPLGGVLSGFFGGLSGYQGSLRTAFLIKSGLRKEAFIGTSAWCSVIVDVTRLVVYGFSTIDFSAHVQNIFPLLAAAIVTASAGSYIGSKCMRAITFRTLQLGVGILLFVLGFLIILNPRPVPNAQSPDAISANFSKNF